MTHEDSGTVGASDARTPLPFGAQGGTALAPGDDRVLHSDPHDFAGLYIRHRSSFTLHARRYLRDSRDAEEVVQEAFLRLFLALPELETELQALAYCRRTITNLCIDRYRAQSRRPNLVALESVPVEELAEEDHGDPVIRAEDAATVREALSLLSPLHRAALVKREIEEKPLPQIADELEIPEESVKHVLFRARRALRRILASTSLAPGADGEAGGALGRVLTKGHGGVAALVLLLALGLSTGPDLRSIPVAGSVLPDLPSITDVVRAVGEAVTGGGGDPATGSAGGGTGTQGGPQAFDGPGPLNVVPGASPSPGADGAADPMDAVSATATAGMVPLPESNPTPSLSQPTAAVPSPPASLTDLPSLRPPSKPVVADPVRQQPAPDSKPGAPSSKGKPDSGTPDKVKPDTSKPDTSKPDTSKKAPVTATAPAGSTSGPSPKPAAAAPKDPEAWDTPGLVWQNDPKTQQPVLAPLGSMPGFDS